MDNFLENHCRLCSKTFCCFKCRQEHEENVHNINPECEICIYGRTTIKKASVSLLDHIKRTHWPLHCVFCKQIFTSLDELVPHNKCSLQMQTLGTPKTPVTPVTDNCDEPSPQITPFYISIKNGNQKNTTAVTSTPLVPKDETDKNEKITPVNKSQISCIQKSNLKLTGSSNLTDSKKSDRRVTFSETPSFSEGFKNRKYFPLMKQTEDEKQSTEGNNSTDDSFVSLEDEFKTAPAASTTLEEINNTNKKMVILEKCNSNGPTLWESALNSSVISNTNNQFNVSLQINVFNSTTAKSDDDASFKEDIENKPFNNKSTNIWTSMTNIVKSVVSNISITGHNSFTSTKRSQPDNDVTEMPSFKRMKLTDIKCRRPIRELSPSYLILSKPRCVDKATQTDDNWI